MIVMVGFVRGMSIVVRRYFAAMLEARMQATLRRGVVDKYLTAPLSFHHSRPTGELLAHADADVSGTTMVIKPLPFSIGVIALVEREEIEAVDRKEAAVRLQAVEIERDPERRIGEFPVTRPEAAVHHRPEPEAGGNHVAAASAGLRSLR